MKYYRLQKNVEFYGKYIPDIAQLKLKPDSYGMCKIQFGLNQNYDTMMIHIDDLDPATEEEWLEQEMIARLER